MVHQQTNTQLNGAERPFHAQNCPEVSISTEVSTSTEVSAPKEVSGSTEMSQFCLTGKKNILSIAFHRKYFTETTEMQVDVIYRCKTAFFLYLA